MDYIHAWSSFMVTWKKRIDQGDRNLRQQGRSYTHVKRARIFTLRLPENRSSTSCDHGYWLHRFDRVTKASVFIILTMYSENIHDDVIKRKHFLRYWSFVWGIHRSPVNSPNKGQWRGAMMFSSICAWINGWVHNREADDLKHHRAHWDVIVISSRPLIGKSFNYFYHLGVRNYSQNGQRFNFSGTSDKYVGNLARMRSYNIRSKKPHYIHTNRFCII